MMLQRHMPIFALENGKSDGTPWEHEELENEIKRQLEDAADGVCPECAAPQGGRNV
jgi:hypothetical protein